MINCDYIKKQDDVYSTVYKGDQMIMTTKRRNYLKSQPLTFTATDDSRPTLSIYLGNGFTNLQYCWSYKGDGTDVWNNITGTNEWKQFTVTNSISLRANWANNRISPDTSLFSWDGGYSGWSDMAGSDFHFIVPYNIHASGNINSLLAYNFENITSLANYGSSTFRYLFGGQGYSYGAEDMPGYNNNSISDIILPATTLSPYCYAYMFWGIPRVIKEIPNELLPKNAILAKGCCEGMFYDYTGLRFGNTKPSLSDACVIRRNALPPTTLAENCYREMFGSLGHFFPMYTFESGFKLPATTLYPGCYGNMFRGCKFSVDMVIPKGMLPAKTLATNCYLGMFYSSYWCDPADSDVTQGAKCRPTHSQYIKLPAKYLPENAYYQMFYNSSLNEKPDADYTDMVSGTSIYQWLNQTFISSSTLSKVIWDKVIDLTSGYYNYTYSGLPVAKADAVFPLFTGTGNPFTGTFANCSNVNDWPALPVNAASQVQNYTELYKGYSQVSRTYTGTLDKVSSCDGMFWNSGITSADITFTNSVIGDNFCKNMFYKCESLTSVRIVFDSSCTFEEATGVFQNMTYGCTSLTTITIKGLPDMSTWDYTNHKLDGYFVNAFRSSQDSYSVYLDLPKFIDYDGYSVKDNICGDMCDYYGATLYLPGPSTSVDSRYFNLYKPNHVVYNTPIN